VQFPQQDYQLGAKNVHLRDEEEHPSGIVDEIPVDISELAGTRSRPETALDDHSWDPGSCLELGESLFVQGVSTDDCFGSEAEIGNPGRSISAFSQKADKKQVQ
jgi:hypothetical protein